ncbi:MAG TPA: response regulator [Cyclobacteriaceae bacterium]
MAKDSYKNKKALIVEDDLITLMSLEVMLHNYGFELVGKTDTGEKVIELVKETSPDIIIMDGILAERMTGLEVAEELRKSHNTPIVFITALSDKHTRLRMLNIEHCDWVTKPITEESLFTKIAEVMP